MQKRLNSIIHRAARYRCQRLDCKLHCRLNCLCSHKRRNSPSSQSYVIVGRNSQWLDNGREVIELRNNSGTLTDSVGPFSDEENGDATWQRSPNGEDNWVFSSNTLGASNSATLVTDPVSPLALAPEQTIQSEPSPSGNSSVEGHSGNSAKSKSNYSLCRCRTRRGNPCYSSQYKDIVDRWRRARKFLTKCLQHCGSVA